VSFKINGTIYSEKNVHELKDKIARMVGRSRHESSMKGKANKKIEALSEHIEKLMVHLKKDAASRARAVNDLGRTSRELELYSKEKQSKRQRPG
jgi:hypothetical protein